MYGMGWHQSQEEGKTLVNYAPKKKGAKALAMYVNYLSTQCQSYSISDIRSSIRSFLRSPHCTETGFHVCSLVPQCNFKVLPTSMCLLGSFIIILLTSNHRDAVLSFGDALDGISPQRPFTNSLTATRQGFCNFQHQDKDKAPIAYGPWWAGKKTADDKWSFTPDADHGRIRGGEFMWGGFGIGVDFAKFSFVYSQ